LKVFIPFDLCTAMNDTWLAELLFFLSASLLVVFLHRYYTRDYAAKEQINRRLSTIEQTGDQREALAILQRERGFGSWGSWSELDSLRAVFVQSGLPFQGTKFRAAIAGLFAAITALATMAIGFQPASLAVAVAGTIIIVFVYARIVRRRRILKFSAQLADVLDIIVRSLRAGHPLQVSLGLVAREMPDPAGTEFGIAADEIAFGLDVPAALQNMSRRVGDPDLVFLVMTATIQTQTGGNLAEILSRLAKLIRARFALRRKVQSLTAQGRFTAATLTALPFLIFFAIKFLNPAYYGEVWNRPEFRMAMAAGVVMLFVGNFIMRRMINFKY
jgi:tight adherence protein B